MTDVLIIGLGGAGGIAADVLTRAGAEVVSLEAGPRYAGAEMTQDEVRNEVQAWLAAPKARHEAPTWRSDPGRAAGAAPWPTLMVNGVGGSTVHYPGLSARFAPWKFRSRSATIERYGASAIPAGSTLADWPLGYDELEPFYEAVEGAIGVAGSAGANRFEGDRRASTRCRPSAAAAGRISPTRRPARSGGIPFPHRPRSTRSRTTGTPRAPTAGSAPTTAAIATRRARPT